MLKCTEVITVRETYQGSLLVIFTCLLRFLSGNSFRKSFTELEQSDRFQPGKTVEIIGHVSNSISYRKNITAYIGQGGGNVGLRSKVGLLRISHEISFLVRLKRGWLFLS